MVVTEQGNHTNQIYDLGQLIRRQTHE